MIWSTSLFLVLGVFHGGSRNLRCRPIVRSSLRNQCLRSTSVPTPNPRRDRQTSWPSLFATRLFPTLFFLVYLLLEISTLGFVHGGVGAGMNSMSLFHKTPGPCFLTFCGFSAQAPFFVAETVCSAGLLAAEGGVVSRPLFVGLWVTWSPFL